MLNASQALQQFADFLKSIVAFQINIICEINSIQHRARCYSVDININIEHTTKKKQTFLCYSSLKKE